jgi:hypothetical protein
MRKFIWRAGPIEIYVTRNAGVKTIIDKTFAARSRIDI